MKISSTLKEIAFVTVLIALASFQAVAQPGPGGGGRGGILTQEQRSKLREAMQSSQAELTQLNEKLVAAQKEAIKAALADKPDEASVRAKVEAVAKIQTDIAMLRFKGLKDIKSTLTDDQKSRMDERPQMGYMMLFGGFGGFGGGGGRRGGGAGAGGSSN